ncbi:MAG: hypothetical protein ACREVC_06765 [Burkholderiales bacterium]
MIIVIQCASRKQPAAGQLETLDGRKVLFVADPSSAPPDDAIVYARPDDASDRGASWRDVLLDYNRKPENPLGLLPAWKLYGNPVYGRLVASVGAENVYILSAGWGLITARFLTPKYDITFSQSADGYKRRQKSDRYSDFRLIADGVRGPIVFFGGKDYLPLFANLTSSIGVRKVVFYNSAQVPPMPRCVLKLFETRTRTNWHYECANAFLDGRITAD